MEEKHFGPVWFLPGENRGRYPFCHSVYIEDAQVLIDPASDRQRLLRLRQSPGVKEVWLSHWHEDHFMHLDLFDDLPLRLAAVETEPLSSLEKFLDWYGLEEAAVREQWKILLQSQFHFRPRQPTHAFTAGEVLQLSSVTAEVIHTPGHTPGHMAFFFREPGVLFLGDYDLTRFGPWYGDRDSSIEQTIASVRGLQQIPARVWLTAHEEGVFAENPAERWEEYLRVIEERESRLWEYLSAPRTLENIVNQWIVYRKPREPRSFFEFGERAIMKKHLDRLCRQGEVMEEGGRYWRRA